MSLRQEVMSAFSKTPYPGDDALTHCGCDDCRWEVARFRGKKWTRLSLDDFGAADGGANVALLAPAAFHYFLPGLILLVLDHPESGGYILDRIIMRLAFSEREGEIKKAKVGQLVKRLTVQQRQVVIDVIRQAEDSVPHVPVIWRSALGTLLGGAATPYDQAEVDRWLVEEYGAKSGLPGHSGAREG